MNQKQGSNKEENPFSFRTYLESGTSEEIEAAAAAATIATEPAGKNPFSFKNFLVEEDQTTSLPNLQDLPDIPTPPLPQPTDFQLTSPNLLDLPEITAEVIVPDVPPEWTTPTTTKASNESDSQKIIAKQKEKIEKLEKKLRLLMDKEENENKTLAMVAAQVEKNLEEANKRRVTAESALELLKLENGQLKTQVLSLSNENLLLKANVNMSGAGLFKSIGDIAAEINEAALAAENSLTYLGTGVNTLRLIASRLQSLEKISEIVN